MLKYYIYDTCVSEQEESTWLSPEKLGVPLPKKEWLALLKKEIEAYCECYETDDYELTSEQFIMNMMQALKGEPICINGMEYIQKEE